MYKYLEEIPPKPIPTNKAPVLNLHNIPYRKEPTQSSPISMFRPYTKPHSIYPLVYRILKEPCLNCHCF